MAGTAASEVAAVPGRQAFQAVGQHAGAVIADALVHQFAVRGMSEPVDLIRDGDDGQLRPEQGDQLAAEQDARITGLP